MANQKPKATKPRPRKAKRSPTKGRKRETISGRYGDGEKAAEKLARRIQEIVRKHGLYGDGSFDAIKAELLASGAITVTETTAEAIGEGWVELSSRGEVIEYADDFGEDRHFRVYWADDGDSRYVRLIPAPEPRIVPKTRRGR